MGAFQEIVVSLSIFAAALASSPLSSTTDLASHVACFGSFRHRPRCSLSRGGKVCFLSPIFSRSKNFPNLSRRYTSPTQTFSYRKFHDYAWSKLLTDDQKDADTELQRIDTVPNDLRSNSSPVKGAPPGTNVVANIRSISRFPFLDDIMTKEDIAGTCNNKSSVLQLARSAFLETQNPENEALITPMTIHVLNFVLFPNPRLQIKNADGSDEYLVLPILGADIVSLPGNKHLVALDFQPVLPLHHNVVVEEDAINTSDGDTNINSSSLFPLRYSHLEAELESIHAKYQKSTSDSEPLLPWGGDIPPQAQRFFSPYALWTRLTDENSLNTVNTTVWESFQDYLDLYFELMSAVQSDLCSGQISEVKLSKSNEENGGNPVWKGQMEYLEYRRANDPARPMLQRLYGDEWAESVIGNVLFPKFL